MSADAAAAAAASSAGMMRTADFERLNGRPDATSSALSSRASITFVSAQAKLGNSPNGTTYTGQSALIKTLDGRTESWNSISQGGKQIPWRALGTFGMGMSGLKPVNPESLGSSIGVGSRMAVSACGSVDDTVNHWMSPDTMNWTLFPVVFKVPGAFAVVPFICMISTTPPARGPPLSGMPDGRAPVWRALPTMISPSISFMVDTSHVNMDNWDAQMSIAAAVNVYFPRFAAPGQYFLMLQPFGEVSQVKGWQNQAGLLRGSGDEYLHLAAHGASLGLAVAACCVGLPSLMYTGYTSNIARRATLPSRKSNFNLTTGELIGGVETAGTSDWVETVQDVDFKIGWAFANAYPLVIPMVDALTSLNMATVMKNLTRAYTVWYPAPKGTVPRPEEATLLSRVWGSNLQGIAETMGQYAMFANNPELTIYSASDSFSGGKYIRQGGVILAAGSMSEALVVSFAAANAYFVEPNFDARNNTQDQLWPGIEKQLVDKASVIQQVDAEKKVVAKAKRAENKKLGIKPVKGKPKPKRVTPKNAQELREYRTKLTQYAKESTAKRKTARAASVAKRGAGRAPTRAASAVGADGGMSGIRNAPGVSKDLAYAQMLTEFLTSHNDAGARQSASDYYEKMGTTHDDQRITPFGRTGVVRSRPGFDPVDDYDIDDSALKEGRSLAPTRQATQVGGNGGGNPLTRQQTVAFEDDPEFDTPGRGDSVIPRNPERMASQGIPSRNVVGNRTQYEAQRQAALERVVSRQPTTRGRSFGGDAPAAAATGPTRRQSSPQGTAQDGPGEVEGSGSGRRMTYGRAGGTVDTKTERNLRALQNVKHIW